MLGIQLADLGEGLPCALQVALGQVHFTQPVLGVASVLTIGVFAQKGVERLTGLVEILGFDQVKSSVVIELLFGRIARFATGGRLLRGGSTCSGTGGFTTSGRILWSHGRSAGSNTPIQVLVTLQAFLFHARNIVLQLFDDALLTRQLILHLLQLHEQLTLRRGRGRNPSPGVGAVRTITRWRVAACAAIASVVINNRNLSPSHEWQAERQDG
ncbi:hypothetical protein D3C80_1434390 [compost metagenome]